MFPSPVRPEGVVISGSSSCAPGLQLAALGGNSWKADPGGGVVSGKDLQGVRKNTSISMIYYARFASKKKHRYRRCAASWDPSKVLRHLRLCAECPGSNVPAFLGMGEGGIQVETPTTKQFGIWQLLNHAYIDGFGLTTFVCYCLSSTCLYFRTCLPQLWRPEAEMPCLIRSADPVDGSSSRVLVKVMIRLVFKIESFNGLISWRENLQETIDFPMKYGMFL